MEDPKVAPEAEAAVTSSSPEFVEKVQAGLDAFNESMDDSPRATVEDTPAGEQPVEGEKPAEEPVAEAAPAVEGEETPAETPAEKPAEAAAETPSTLPAAYRRTAKAREWTDEEIDGFVDKDPGLAMKTFGKMHESRVKEVNEWAALGRATKGTPAPAAKPTESQAAPADASALAPLDIQAMIDKYGNDDLIRELAGPVNAAIAALGPIVQQAQSSQKVAAKVAEDTLGKQIETFFHGDEMKAFGPFYGTDPKTLTPEQVQTRLRVLETADALIVGANAQGRRLDVEEALTLAHDTVSVTYKEQAIRERIKGAVTARQKSITLKPSHRGSARNDGPPKDRQEMERRASDRLREVFG